MSNELKGVSASLIASGLFSFMYYYATLLSPLTGVEIFGWRMILTAPFMTLFVIKAGYWHLVIDVKNRIKKQPVLIPLILFSAFILGIQCWLFLWAPINGHALNVSLGYLLLPLTLVLVGRIVYKEKLKLYQKIAVSLAALGVANQLYQLGSISWPVLVIALGYPVYFVTRKKISTDNLGGMWFDFVLIMPAALYAIISGSSGGFFILTKHPSFLFLLPLLGLMSALALACFVTASKLLPLGVFGLLGYVEPVLLVIVSILIGERISVQEFPTYIGVFSAVIVLCYGGIKSLKKFPQKL